MGTTNSPYGMIPQSHIGGRPNANSGRWYSIASAATTPIFTGDPVIYTTTGAGRGTIVRFSATVATTTVTAAISAVGVFGGCEYTDPISGQKFQRRYYPGAVVASDIRAFIYDDPDQLFKIRANGSVAQTRQGCNASVIQTNLGNTATGNSGISLHASSLAATATLPLRVHDFASSVGDAFTDLLVTFNTHFHRQATGVAAT